MPEDRLTYLGIRIHDARKACKLTQQELSDETGVSIKMIQCIENGSVNPSYEILFPIVNRLGFLSRGTFLGMGKIRLEKPRGRLKAVFGGRQYKTLTPPRAGAWSVSESPYSCGFGDCAANLNVHAPRLRIYPYPVLWERPGARGQSHRKTYRQPPHQCRRFCR